jgi:hypothetical protein
MAHHDGEAAIRAYVEDEAGEQVVHLEHSASEMVGPVRHEIWDVHCSDSRWWVVTNPTNLYSQADFKSRDVVLSFHIGLMLRVAALNERRVPVAPEQASWVPGSWRRWQQAFKTYECGDEAETFPGRRRPPPRVPGLLRRRGDRHRDGARGRHATEGG